MKTMRPRARRTVVGFAAALAFVAGGTAAVAASTVSHVSARSSAQAIAAHRTEQAARARASLLRYLSEGYRPQADLARDGGLRPSSPNLNAGSKATAQVGSVGSYNWSGYADTSAAGTFTAVSGSWRQPATVCSQEQRLTAFWIGLDGYSDSTVEQDGTLAYCFEGVPSYYSWWEMYPGNSVTVGSTVRPGDLISASVTVADGTSYTLSLTDSTTPANSFSTVQTCLPAGTCQNSSAEWIAERPAFQVGITPLSFFLNWSLTNGSQTSDGTKGSIGFGPNATKITMVDATLTYPLVSISAPRSGGTGFGAHWLNSY